MFPGVRIGVIKPVIEHLDHDHVRAANRQIVPVDLHPFERGKIVHLDAAQPLHRQHAVGGV